MKINGIAVAWVFSVYDAARDSGTETWLWTDGLKRPAMNAPIDWEIVGDAFTNYAAWYAQYEAPTLYRRTRHTVHPI